MKEKKTNNEIFNTEFSFDFGEEKNEYFTYKANKKVLMNEIKETKNMENELRPFWSRLFNFNWKFGLFLILIVCIPRFILVLKANSSGNYGYIGLVMTISAIAPFLFLSKYHIKF